MVQQNNINGLSVLRGAAQSESVLRHCLHELFEEQARRTPDSLSLISGDTHLTYRELNARANAVAHQLRARGVLPYSRIVIPAERSIDTIVGLLAILKAGGVYVPLDPKDPAERRTFLLADTAPHLILTSPQTTEQFANMGIPILEVNSDITPEEATENLPCVTSPENGCYVMYTSGSTGKPKGVLVPHRAVVHLVRETNYADFSSRQVFLQLAPLSFDASTLEIWGALANGATLVLAPAGTLSLSNISDTIEQNKVSTLWLTAGLFHALVDHNLQALAPLTQLLAGGDVLSPSHVAKVMDIFPDLRLINGYGPTETTTFALCHTITRNDLDKPSIPIGSPIAGTEVFVLDEQQNLVPVGTEGELYIGGAGVARGYLNQDELTKARFIANPFSRASEPLYRTGDRVKQGSDGLIEFLGRVDEQVKVRGFRIELGEIEQIISRHPQVKQNTVVAKSRENADKELVGYVVLHPAPTQPTENEMKQFIANTLPDYMLPSQILFLQEFPLTANGKIDRRALPDPPPVRTRPTDMPSAYAAPQNKWEAELVRLWEELLHVSPLGANDNVFSLGAQSLQVIQIHRQIALLAPVAPDITSFFQYPTPRALARYLSGLSMAGAPVPTPKPQQSRAQQQREALAQMKRPRAERLPSRNAS